MSDKLLREKLRAGTPRGSAVEMAVTEIIVRKWRETDTKPPRRPTDYSKPWRADA